MNKFKDKDMNEDIFCEAISSNTSIVAVENIVKDGNKSILNDVKSNVDIEREKYSD